MEFSGRLSAFPVAEILQWVQNDRRTGNLLLRSGGREKWVSFHEGKVVACVAQNPEELYSQYLILNGHLDPQTVATALSYGGGSGRRLGWALAKLGILSPEAVKETLRRHIEDSVCGLFLWRRGAFFFEREEIVPAEPLPETVDTIALVMEGTRWVDEYQRICASFIHDNVLIARGPAWPGNNLTPAQEQIAAKLSRERPLASVFADLKGNYFRFLEQAFRLTEDGVLAIAGWATGEHGSWHGAGADDEERDTGVQDLALFSQKNMIKLLSLVSNLYPVWLRQPGTETWSVEETRKVLERIDGRHSMRQICAGTPLERNRRMELVLREVERGTIGLLPTSRDQLDAAGGGPAAPHSQSV